MSAYLKGGIVAVALMAGIFFWYRANMAELPVNKSPEHFQLITKMEKEGVPDFTLEKVGESGAVRLSELRGKVLIINFWASWCNPCVEEFPSMVKLVERFQGDVVVVAVSTDDNEQDIQAFMKAFGLPKPGFTVLWDKDKKLMQAYGVDKIPESFLVRKDLTLVRKVMGIENWASADAIEYFDSLLK